MNSADFWITGSIWAPQAVAFHWLLKSVIASGLSARLREKKWADRGSGEEVSVLRLVNDQVSLPEIDWSRRPITRDSCRERIRLFVDRRGDVMTTGKHRPAARESSIGGAVAISVGQRIRIHSSNLTSGTETTMDTTTKRTIRRAELRRIVPLADTTIYMLEKNGEFPKRFYLTDRCAVWDLAEVEAWVEEKREAARTPQTRRGPDVKQRKRRPVREGPSS